MESEYLKEYVTYDDEMLEYIAVQAINDNEKDKIVKMKVALKCGLDPSKLLRVCIINNDIGAIINLLKQNFDIVKCTDDQQLLHLCVGFNNTNILTYLIDKKADINIKDNEGHTPLSLAIEFSLTETTTKSYEKCIKILLDKKAKIPKALADGELLFPTYVLYMIQTKENDNGQKIMSNIVDIINFKQLVNNDDLMECIYSFVICEQLEYLKVVIKKFPGIVNILYNGCTLLSLAIKEDKHDIAEYLLSLDNIDLTIKFFDNHTYLHMLCDVLKEDLIIKLFTREKKLKDLSGRRSYIEWVIMAKEAMKNVEKVIKIIRYFAKHGVDVNKMNGYGWYALECAIQFSTKDIVEVLIDLGANINRNKNFDDYHPAIMNNDPIGFASQNGKLDIVKLLIEKKAISHICTINKQKIPTSIIQGINHGYSDIVLYLLGTDIIKPYINNTTKKILFDIAIKEGNCDKMLLQNLAPDNGLVENIVFDINYQINGVINFVNRIISYGSDWEVDPFVILHNITTVYKKFFTFNGKQKQMSNILRATAIMYESITSCSNIAQMESLITIISLKMHSADINKLKQTFQTLIELQIDDDIIYEDIDHEKIKELRNEYTQKEVQSLLDLHTLLGHVIEHDKRSHKNLKVDDKKDTVNPESLLFKLLWPVKLNNYDYLHKQIFENCDVLSEINDMVVVRTKDRIIFRVYGLTTGEKPSKWFKTYAPNICREDKRDLNHTFSFAFDTILCNYRCIEKKTVDIMHKGKMNTLMYFSGEIDKLGTIIPGNFEYFVNGYGTLFHRMFRPHK